MFWWTWCPLNDTIISTGTTMGRSRSGTDTDSPSRCNTKGISSRTRNGEHGFLFISSCCVCCRSYGFVPNSLSMAKSTVRWKTRCEETREKVREGGKSKTKKGSGSSNHVWMIWSSSRPCFRFRFGLCPWSGFMHGVVCAFSGSRTSFVFVLGIVSPNTPHQTGRYILVNLCVSRISTWESIVLQYLYCTTYCIQRAISCARPLDRELNRVSRIKLW